MGTWGPTWCCRVSHDCALVDHLGTVVYTPPATCPREGQRGNVRVGPSLGRPHTFRSCICNAEVAIKRRHLAVPKYPQTRDIPIDARLQRLIAQHYQARIGGHGAAWFAKWPSGKRAGFLRSYLTERCKPDRCEALIKRELGGSRPRVIQKYVNLHTQGRFGPQHTIFQKAAVAALQDYAWTSQIRISATSGWNAQRFTDWANALPSGWRIRERDAKGYDSCVTRQHKLVAARYMEACDPALADFVRAGISCSGYYKGDGDLRYSNDGTTRSGFNDTTSSNTIINATIAAESFRRAGIAARILVIGDDLLAAYDGSASDNAQLDGFEREYGIEPESASFTDICMSTFAGGTWEDCGGRVAYYPRLGKLLEQLFITVSPPSQRRYPRYLHGIATGFLSTYGGHPFFETLLRQHVVDLPWQDGFAHKACGTLDVSRREHEAAMDSYCTRRGVCPTQFRTDLASFASGKPGRWPVLERCRDIDLADPSERWSHVLRPPTYLGEEDEREARRQP